MIENPVNNDNLLCLRCAYVWTSKLKSSKPKRCPKCLSYYWYLPKKLKNKADNAPCCEISQQNDEKSTPAGTLKSINLANGEQNPSTIITPSVNTITTPQRKIKIPKPEDY